MNTKKNIKHFCLLTGMALGCIYGINKWVETTSDIKNYLSENKGLFFDWRYGSIFYKKQGTGSPILLIHDLHPASSSIEWNCLIQQLEKDHTVYAIDLLGCGRSDKPNLTYTNYMFVQLLTDFIKYIIQEKTDLIATGDSCSFCLMAANMDASIINRLFFVSPSPLESFQANPNSKGNLLKRILELPVIGTFFYHLQMTEQKITELFEKKYIKRKPLISQKIKDSYYEAAHKKRSGGRYLFGSMLGNYTNINIIPALKKIEHPIFLIGSRDDEESLRIMESYVKYDEAIETATISNCRKLPQLEEPEKLFKILRMFYNA